MSDHESKHEDWQECAEWLNKFHVLPDDHVTLGLNGNAINLLQALQDGVILCNLAVNISSGEIDLKSYKNFNNDPQNSQFLCCHNIKLFLDLCENYFKLDKTLLFNVNDLYQANNFGKVISLLLELRKVTAAIRKQKRSSFAKTYSKDSRKTEYNFEDTIYDTVLYQGHVKKISHSTPRDHCIKEIIETEKNYVDLLNMLLENYKKPLINVLSDQELSEIFKHIDKLSLLHKELYRNLLLATQSETPPFTLSQVFIRIRDSLLIYGEYSGHLLRAKSLVRDIVNNDEEKKKKIDLCRESADDKCKFELVELLTVPMQRVLKYHLLLEQLCKLTDNSNPEKQSLIEAHIAMKDLADFTNEVKRDLDMINSINRIQECLEDLYFPPNKSLKSYGRLQMDGELRVSVDGDSKIRSRHVFLFDRMFLICKQKGPNFTFMKAYFVTSFPIERIDSPVKKNNKQWTYGFRLFLHTEKDKNHVNFFAKSEEIRSSWYEAIEIAKNNVCPPGARDKNYFFEFFDFPEHAYCSICKKILKGCFFQGYRCKFSGMIAHKNCLLQNNLKPFQIIPSQASPPPNILQHHQSSSMINNNNNNISSSSISSINGPFQGQINQSILRPSQVQLTNNNSSILLPSVNNNNGCLPHATNFDMNNKLSTSAINGPIMASQINNSSGYNSAQISRNISNVSSNNNTTAGDTFLIGDDEEFVNRNFLRRSSLAENSCLGGTPPGSLSSGNRTKQMATPNQSPLHSNHGSFCGSMAIVIKPYNCSTNPIECNLIFGETVVVIQTKNNQTLIQKDNRLEFWVPSAILESVQTINDQSTKSFDSTFLNENNNNTSHISKLSSQNYHMNNLSFDNTSDSVFLTKTAHHSSSLSSPPPVGSLVHLMSNANRRHTTDLRSNPDFVSFNRCSSFNPQQGNINLLTSQLSRLKVNEDLAKFPWFLGNMDRNEAMGLLQNCDNGTFLVRVSQNHERLGELSLSLVYQEPRHIRIHRKLPSTTPNDINQQTIFYLSSAKCFSSISSLIEHYQKNSLESCFDGICTNLLHSYIRCPNLINPLLAQALDDFNPDEEYQTINPITDIYAKISLMKGELVVIMITDLDRHTYPGYSQGWRRGRVGIFPRHLLHINNG